MCDETIDIHYSPMPPKYVYLLCSRSNFKSRKYIVLSCYETEEQVEQIIFNPDMSKFVSMGKIFYIKHELFYSCPF